MPTMPTIAMGSLNGLAPSFSISDNHASFSFARRILGFCSSAMATTLKPREARADTFTERGARLTATRLRAAIPLRSIEEKRNGASAWDLSRWCGSGIFILPQLTRLWCRAGRVAHLVEARSERAAVAVTRVAVEATVKDIFPIR